MRKDSSLRGRETRGPEACPTACVVKTKCKDVASCFLNFYHKNFTDRFLGNQRVSRSGLGSYQWPNGRSCAEQVKSRVTGSVGCRKVVMAIDGLLRSYCSTVLGHC